MKRTTENWVSAALASAFLVYVALRAWLLPITHDEGATILNHVPRLVFDTLTFEKEANPNNHILNTLGIKVMLGLFPGNQLVVRLPVLIGCAFYVWAAVQLSRRWSEQVWVRLFTLVILLGSPCLSEFFGLARGYGLAIGLMAMAILKAWDFFENNSARTLRSAFIFAGLAVYANFTLLLFFGPFCVLLLAAAWQKNRSWVTFWPVIRPAFYTIGIFVLLWITPLSRLSKDRELVNWEQLGSNFDTIQRQMTSMIHRNPYLGENTVLMFSWAALIGIIIGLAMAIWQWRKQNWQLFTDPKVFVAALFAGALVANLINTQVLHTAQLNARLSLFFYPLFALLLAGMADWLWSQWGKRSWIYLAPLCLLLLINNVRCLDLRRSFEWWFDADNFEVLNKMREIQTSENRTTPYSFDCNWAMLNSFTCHVNEFPQGYDRLAEHLVWHPDRVPVVGPEFFYAIKNEDISALNDAYEVVCKTSTGTLLHKKQGQ